MWPAEERKRKCPVRSGKYGSARLEIVPVRKPGCGWIGDRQELQEQSGTSGERPSPEEGTANPGPRRRRHAEGDECEAIVRRGGGLYRW